MNIRQADVLDKKEVRFAINKSPSDGFILEVCVVRAWTPHRPQPCHADRHFRRWEISVSLPPLDVILDNVEVAR